MNIIKKQEGTTLIVSPEGRLDTVTAPQLEGELRTAVNGISELVFDLGKLEYVSSAGLRVLLSAQKVMNRQGSMTIRNVKPEIMEIFEVTGFVDINKHSFTHRECTVRLQHFVVKFTENSVAALG